MIACPTNQKALQHFATTCWQRSEDVTVTQRTGKEPVKECFSIQGRNGLRAHDQREALRKRADLGRGESL